MPIYPPHFKRANLFIGSFLEFRLDKQADLAFIFTNQDEAHAFKNISSGIRYREIILSEELQCGDKRIINIKKFYGLQRLQNKYKYIIVLDAETIVVKNINLMKMCRKFEKHKILYGNENLANAEWIYSDSKKFFSLEEQDKIRNELYLWFNQPCIYICSHLKDFFDKTALNDLSRRKDEITKGSFDYYIYMYYLILFCNYKVKDLDVVANYAFLETNAFVPQDSRYRKIRFYWSSAATYGFINSSNIFMLMHIDRGLEVLRRKLGLHSACSRIKNNLSYKIGKCIVEHSFFVLPFYLFEIIKTYKKNQRIIKYAFAEKLPTLNQYPDYPKALEMMDSSYYEIGNAFLRGRGIIFKIIFILKVKLRS